EKHNRYSNWEARVAAETLLNSSSGKISSQAVNRRRKLKTLSQRLPFRPLLRFLYIYVWQKGFLDGAEGYYFARLHGFYEFLSVAKTRELQRQCERKTDWVAVRTVRSLRWQAKLRKRTPNKADV